MISMMHVKRILNALVKTNDDSLSVKVSTDTNTLEAIRQEASSKESLSMQGDVITAV